MPNKQSGAGSVLPLLALGFRPFYLVAALFAVFAIPLWILLLSGRLQWQGYLSGLAWHSHEMVFGFASAVMAGFLLTAVKNWTGRPTPTGTPLALLALVWVAARITLIFGPGPVAAVIDSMFLPLLAVMLAIPIWQSKNTRNLKILVVLTALAVVNILFHLAWHGVVQAIWTSLSIRLALDIFTILMAIIGGRVIPAFTSNAVPDAQPKRLMGLEILAIGTLLVIPMLRIFELWASAPALLWQGLFLLAASAHLIRLLLWKPHRTVSNPLLMMLPMAYAWIPVSLTLQAMESAGFVAATGSVHALTLGAMTSLMLAMMTRSALGHTGRPLVAGPAEMISFGLVQAAAVVRVSMVFLPAVYYQAFINSSGLMWSVAFGVFLWKYIPVFTRSRVDGKPG